MSEIKAFFFDNDSTLFDHTIGNSGISKSTIESLKKLKSNGYKLVLNTSRSYDECFNIPKEVMDIFDYIILLSGAYIIHNGKVEVVYFDKEDTKKAIKYFDDNNFTYRYCTDDGLGYLNKNDPDKEALFKRLYDMVPPIKKYEGEDVIHLLFYAPQENLKYVKDMLKNSEAFILTLAEEIAPKGCTKGLGMIKVLNDLGLDTSNACAFGDSNNDLDMLQKAGLGIAMGNSTESVKKVADYLTDTVTNDGITKVLKHFGFIE